MDTVLSGKQYEGEVPAGRWLAYMEAMAEQPGSMTYTIEPR